jgi:hypothetical protein
MVIPYSDPQKGPMSGIGINAPPAIINNGTLVYTKNSRSGITKGVILTAAKPVYNLPNIIIPDGRAIVIKASPQNVPLSLILVVLGTTPDTADLTNSYPLMPNESISYYLKNANTIWIGTTMFPSTFFFTVEVD